MKCTRVLIIGLGGIAETLVGQIARWLAHAHPRSELVLIDGDLFDDGNMSRQTVGVYGPKATERRRQINIALGEARDKITITAVTEYLNFDNVARLIREGDYVLLCVDNHATRKLVDDYIGTLTTAVCIAGGTGGMEGDVLLYVRRDGGDVTSPFSKYHKEIANPTDSIPEYGTIQTPGCDEEVDTDERFIGIDYLVAAVMFSLFGSLVKGLFPEDGTGTLCDEVCISLCGEMDGAMGPIVTPIYRKK